MARKQLGPAANLPEDAATKADVDKKANIGHTHALPDSDLIGTLPMSKGGTGATSPNQARLNLGAASENHNHSLSGYSLTGTLPISRGGTGGTTASEARGSLGAASENHIHTLSGPDIGGTLPVHKGGTGATTPAQALSSLGAASQNHTHVPSEVGLGKVNNTADKDKPLPDAKHLGTSDLNTVMTSGYYYQDDGPIATSARNYPVPAAGLLEVVASAAGGFVWQKYTPWAALAEDQWVRGFYQGNSYGWRRVSADPPAPILGSWGGVFATRYNAATSVIERRGADVELSGAITTKLVVSIPQGGGSDIGNISPAPLYNQHLLVPTQGGSLELLIVAGTGLATLRNWSGTTRSLAVGAFVGLGGARYRAVT